MYCKIRILNVFCFFFLVMAMLFVVKASRIFYLGLNLVQYKIYCLIEQKNTWLHLQHHLISITFVHWSAFFVLYYIPDTVYYSFQYLMKFFPQVSVVNRNFFENWNVMTWIYSILQNWQKELKFLIKYQTRMVLIEPTNVKS